MREFNEQEKASLEPFLRKTSKRVPRAGDLLGSPSIRHERPLPPKLSDLEASSLEKANVETTVQKRTQREEPVRSQPKETDQPVRRESPVSELPESVSAETTVDAETKVQSSDTTSAPQAQSTSSNISQGEPPESTLRDAPPQRAPEVAQTSGESVEATQAEKPARSSYDARDKEIGKAVSGLKQEKFRREKRQADQGMKFAKAGAAFIGRMIGSQAGKAFGGVPREFMSPVKGLLGDAVSSMFGGGERGVPMFGEGGDAQVSSEGGGEGGGADIGPKLDRIIELLSQLVQLSGKTADVAGPQADTSFAAGEAAQTMARQMGGKAIEAAAGSSINGSNKGSSSDDMMGVLLQTLMRAAIAAV